MIIRPPERDRCIAAAVTAGRRQERHSTRQTRRVSKPHAGPLQRHGRSRGRRGRDGNGDGGGRITGGEEDEARRRGRRCWGGWGGGG